MKKWTIKQDINNSLSTDSANNKELINNSSVSANAINLNYKIFNKFNFKNTGVEELSFFNRNKISSNTGSLYKKTQKIDKNIDYSILKSLKIKNT